MCIVFTVILTKMTAYITVYCHQWLLCRLRMWSGWGDGHLNGHYQEWLGFTMTKSHGVAAFDFATVSGCDQLVVGLTHAHGGILDLLMTDVPDLIQVAVVARIGNSDHSLLSVVISMAQAVPNLCVSRKVFLKHQVNWNTVCGAMQDLPWRNIWSSDNPVEVFNEHLFPAGWTLCTNQDHPCMKQG